MANEQKGGQGNKPAKIQDLPANTKVSDADQVKGGLISRGGGTDPDADDFTD